MIYFIIIALSIFQLTIAPYLTIASARIDTLLILAVYIILFTPTKIARGFIMCLFCGIMKGLICMDIYNLQVILFAAMGLVLGWIKDKVYKENVFCQMAVIFFVASIISTAEYLITAMEIHPGIIVFSTLYTAAVSPLFFRLFVRLCHL